MLSTARRYRVCGFFPPHFVIMHIVSSKGKVRDELQQKQEILVVAKPYCSISPQRAGGTWFATLSNRTTLIAMMQVCSVSEHAWSESSKGILGPHIAVALACCTRKDAVAIM